ncbi:MAG: menaquinone biosynthesis protein [Bacteroidota bacterium]|nr:menaquinone biosynthesis protein [Bacteroidota bacterium]
MRSLFRISMVSFLNTLPFRYALAHNAKIKSLIEVSEDVPSLCAKKLLSDEVDIGLVPVAILPEMQNYHIITDYCIGAKKRVDSVFLFSEKPMHELDRILLDFRSRTSVQLVKILANNYWNISVEYLPAEPGYESQISGTTGGLVIGDKALELLDEFPYRYDLAEAWYDYTGEEFVFAAWVSRKKLSPVFVKQFNDALAYGIVHLDDAIQTYIHEYPNLPVEQYLKNRIDYVWTESKRRALNQFLNYIS